MCCTSVCVMHQEKFSSFDYKSDRVDEFLGQFIEKDKRFSNLWTACIFVFMLAHGQSRGFNINKAMLVEGLVETSVKRQRLLFHVASKNQKCHYSPIYYFQITYTFLQVYMQ